MAALVEMFMGLALRILSILVDKHLFKEAILEEGLVGHSTGPMKSLVVDHHSVLANPPSPPPYKFWSGMGRIPASGHLLSLSNGRPDHPRREQLVHYRHGQLNTCGYV